MRPGGDRGRLTLRRHAHLPASASEAPAPARPWQRPPGRGATSWAEPRRASGDLVGTSRRSWGSREKSAREGNGRSRGRREGTLVPHDRMQDGGAAPHCVYVRKALYPPVLTPRGTARLREGKCEGKTRCRPPPRPPPTGTSLPQPSRHPPLIREERQADALPPHRRAAGKEGGRCLRGL